MILTTQDVSQRKQQALDWAKARFQGPGAFDASDVIPGVPSKITGIPNEMATLDVGGKFSFEGEMKVFLPEGIVPMEDVWDDNGVYPPMYFARKFAFEYWARSDFEDMINSYFESEGMSTRVALPASAIDVTDGTEAPGLGWWVKKIEWPEEGIWSDGRPLITYGFTVNGEVVHNALPLIITIAIGVLVAAAAVAILATWDTEIVEAMIKAGHTLGAAAAGSIAGMVKGVGEYIFPVLLVAGVGFVVYQFWWKKRSHAYSW